MSGSGYRISFVYDGPSFLQMVTEITQMMAGHIQQLKVEQVAPPEALSAVKDTNYQYQPRVKGGRKARDSGPGQIIMQVVKRLTLVRGADLFDALEKDGHYSAAAWPNTVHKLIEEGALVRAKHGVYREPLPSELRSRPPAT